METLWRDCLGISIFRTTHFPASYSEFPRFLRHSESLFRALLENENFTEKLAEKINQHLGGRADEPMYSPPPHSAHPPPFSIIILPLTFRETDFSSLAWEALKDPLFLELMPEDQLFSQSPTKFRDREGAGRRGGSMNGSKDARNPLLPVPLSFFVEDEPVPSTPATKRKLEVGEEHEEKGEERKEETPENPEKERRIEGEGEYGGGRSPKRRKLSENQIENFLDLLHS